MVIKQYQHLSEEDTKNQIINPALNKAGWTPNMMLMEYSLKSDRFEIIPGENKTKKISASKRNFPDYLLCKYANMPIAVVEAKKYGCKDSEGIDQAKVYAELLDIPFAYSSSGKKFIEFDKSTGIQRELNLDEFPSPNELWERWCAYKGIKDELTRGYIEKAQYRTTVDGKVPRYYQMLAINKTVEAVLIENKKRILLVMATGTGKTYTAFQIVWRLLHEAKAIKNVLFLADRNQLVDQSLIGDFSPLENICTKIQNRKIEGAYQVYFGLYQQLKGHDEDGASESIADVYKQVPPDFFDLIIIDECHRGSAKDESAWRSILDYFKDAIHIGLTATPNEADDANNIKYFGTPIYTYSLKQGIEDGYLAPYQVKRIFLDKDIDGWTPQENEIDINGHAVPMRTYTVKDFDTKIILKQRTYEVARIITSYMKQLGQMSKAIVFCTTQRHALDMRDALRELNSDMMLQNGSYVVRMTADDQEGKALYESFTSVNEPYPVIVTTSKLLTTGADTKCVKLIVLDANIGSKTEFKQIIGRGTRLREDAGKTFFTILDFRNASKIFYDPEFDGIPVQMPEDTKVTKPVKPKPEDGKDDGGDDTPPKEREPIYELDHVTFNLIGETSSYLDENGNIITEKFRVYTRNSIRELFGSQAEFIDIWNEESQKQVIFNKLKEKGILIDQLKQDAQSDEYDEFDLILSVAYGAPLHTRKSRSELLKQSKFLDQYQKPVREVLEALLEVYDNNGIGELDTRKVLQSSIIRSRNFGSVKNILERFGSPENYDKIVRSLVNELYIPTNSSQDLSNVSPMVGR